MRNKAKKTIFNLLAIGILLTYKISPSLSEEALPKEAIGRWSVDCDNSQGITIDSNGEGDFEINSNQIYIKSHVRPYHDGELGAYLSGPADLGRGGAGLSWGDFSKSKPIATINGVESNKFELKWNGFFNDKIGKYQWSKDPDFYDPAHHPVYVFNKCNDG